jgi:hypothetical protein
MTREIVAALGRPDASASEKVSISHSLRRLEFRGLVRSSKGGLVKQWELSDGG